MIKPRKGRRRQFNPVPGHHFFETNEVHAALRFCAERVSAAQEHARAGYITEATWSFCEFTKQYHAITAKNGTSMIPNSPVKYRV